MKNRGGIAIVLVLSACRSSADSTTDTRTDAPTEASANQVGGATGSITEPGHTTSGPAVVSVDAMAERLLGVAQRYPGAEIERLALSDLVFPRDPTESRSLHGYTIVLVTATTQTKAELPPARVYTNCDGELRELTTIVWRSSTIEQEWGRVVGSHRYDGLYLLPLESVGRPECALTMDYAKNRVGQVITVFDVGIPPHVLVLPPGDPPSEAALRAVIEREYPLVVSP